MRRFDQFWLITAGYDFTRAAHHAAAGHAWRALLMAAAGVWIVYTVNKAGDR